MERKGVSIQPDFDEIELMVLAVQKKVMENYASKPTMVLWKLVGTELSQLAVVTKQTPY